MILLSVQNLKKKNYNFPLSILQKPEGLVKITYGFWRIEREVRAGNSNQEKILNCECEDVVLTILQELDMYNAQWARKF